MSLSYIEALKHRDDLKKYDSNALSLFALELRWHIEDIDTIAADILTDFSDDKKCDVVYIDRENGIALIAQGYFANTLKQSAPSNKAADLNTAVGWILTRPLEDLPDKLRPQAIDLRDAIQDGLIKELHFWYVHNLPESSNVKDELKTVESTAYSALNTFFRGVEPPIIQSTEVGNETLEQWYQSLTSPIYVTAQFEIDTPVGGYEIQDGDWYAFVTAVRAKWLYETFDAYKADLFSANVRGYLGSRESSANINNGIKTTANGNPEQFWVYNNGLTILTNSIEIDEQNNKLTIHGLSIVNGAQTTGAIGSLTSAPSERVMVPARFVKCNSSETIRNIITFNNRQNRIEPTDFRSNDETQKRLVKEFQKIPNAGYLGGRRGGDEDTIKRPGNLVLPSGTVAQALASFHQESVVAYNEKARIWVNDEIYSRFFSPKTTAEHIVFAFSLLRAVETKKIELLKSTSLTDAAKVQLDFFRNRGSTFLFASAVAACLEILANRPIPNKFNVSFGNAVSPDDAKIIWKPIIDAAVSFVEHLMPAVQNGLKSTEVANKQIKLFRDLVGATSQSNRGIYDVFSSHLKSL